MGIEDRRLVGFHNRSIMYCHEVHGEECKDLCGSFFNNLLDNMGYAGSYL